VVKSNTTESAEMVKVRRFTKPSLARGISSEEEVYWVNVRWLELICWEDDF
jgi:hypothetical protein